MEGSESWEFRDLSSDSMLIVVHARVVQAVSEDW